MQRHVRFVVATEVSQTERLPDAADQTGLLRFDFAQDAPSSESSLGARGQRKPAATLKERIALWLERKL